MTKNNKLSIYFRIFLLVTTGVWMSRTTSRTKANYATHIANCSTVPQAQGPAL